MSPKPIIWGFSRGTSVGSQEGPQSVLKGISLVIIGKPQAMAHILQHMQNTRKTCVHACEVYAQVDLNATYTTKDKE